jgi:flagellar biosynthetic protein FliR
MPPTLGSPALWALTQTKVLMWLLVVVRISGLMATLPGLGQERIPLQIRAALTVLVSVVITPVVPAPREMPSDMWQLLAVMVMEFASGLLLGLFVAWILEAVAFAGQLMDVQMGFSFVQFLDPTSAHPTSISGSILTQLTLLFILISGLHHQMILALVESYRIVPIGSGMPGNPMQIVSMVGLLLARGLQLAFPVMLTLFFVDALEGISARFMPQLQLMQLAFPFKIAVGLAVLGLLLRQLPAWLLPLLEAAPREALRFLR